MHTWLHVDHSLAACIHCPPDRCSACLTKLEPQMPQASSFWCGSGVGDREFHARGVPQRQVNVLSFENGATINEAGHKVLDFEFSWLIPTFMPGDARPSHCFARAGAVPRGGFLCALAARTGLPHRRGCSSQREPSHPPICGVSCSCRPGSLGCGASCPKPRMKARASGGR